MSAAFSNGVALVALAMLVGCTSNTPEPTTPPRAIASTPDVTSGNDSNAAGSTPPTGTTTTDASPPPERPPVPPFPEVEANPAVPRVTVQELKAAGLCGKQNPIQVTGFVTEIWTCKCVTVDGRTVCDNMCVEAASIRERAGSPKEEGVPVVLPHPARDLFQENGHYVIEGECAMTREPNPKIGFMNLHARSRLPK